MKRSACPHDSAAPIRQQLGGKLSSEGMSTRAIAPIVGTSFQQVVKDKAD